MRLSIRPSIKHLLKPPQFDVVPLIVIHLDLDVPRLDLSSERHQGVEIGQDGSCKYVPSRAYYNEQRFKGEQCVVTRSGPFELSGEKGIRRWMPGHTFCQELRRIRDCHSGVEVNKMSRYLLSIEGMERRTDIETGRK